MPQLTDFAAFIFDMDGLVLDTEPTYFAAWQQTATIMGYQLEPESFVKLSGSHYGQVEAQLQAWFGHDFDLHRFKQLGAECWRDYVLEHGIKIKPGVIALLDYAEQQTISVAIGTNSWSSYAQKCLAIAGLSQRFPVMVAGDDVERAKPEPDIFLKAAEQLHVDIRQCVIFEDSHTGVIAASASGAYTVYVPSTFPVKPETLALCNCMLTDLTQVFESLPT